jgi:hypothetical protein
MRRSWCVLLLALFVAVVATPALAQDNPFLGTWKLNTAKSKFNGAPAPKALTRTITAEGSGTKYSFAGTAADGSAFGYSFVSSYDGKDCAISGMGTPAGADAITLKHVAANKTEGTLKKGGSEVGKVTAEVSKDGKVATVKSKGKTADGKDWSSESVYDKQ